MEVGTSLRGLWLACDGGGLQLIRSRSGRWKGYEIGRRKIVDVLKEEGRDRCCC